MKKILVQTRFTSSLFLFICLLPVSSAPAADQTLISADGREILLKDNGSWEYRSDDHIMSTPDGRRIRLKADGSWQYDGNSSLTSKQQVRTTDLDIKLKKVVIETREKKSVKGKRIKTHTVFYLSLSRSAQANNIIKIDSSDMANIAVTDNNGKSYKVLALQSEHSTLKPGEKMTVLIRADKSPAIWDDVKSMQVTLKPEIFGLQSTATFTQKAIDFETRSVDELGIY